MAILSQPTPWGRITGKLSTTPEQALRLFGFVQNPDALGVILRIYTVYDAEGHESERQVISNYHPPSNPQTPEQQANRQTFADLVKIGKSISEPIITPIWEPWAKHRHKNGAHGHNEFRSVNISRVQTPPDWDNLLLSIGNLEGTGALSGLWHAPDYATFSVNFDPTISGNGSPTDSAKAGVLFVPQVEMRLLTPLADWRRHDAVFQGTCTPPSDPFQFILFLYFHRRNFYSHSISMPGT